MQQKWVRSLVRKIPWRRKWQPTPVFLPGKSHGQRSLEACSPWDRKRVRHNLATKQQQNSELMGQLVEGNAICAIVQAKISETEAIVTEMCPSLDHTPLSSSSSSNSTFNTSTRSTTITCSWRKVNITYLMFMNIIPHHSTQGNQISVLSWILLPFTPATLREHEADSLHQQKNETNHRSLLPPLQKNKSWTKSLWLQNPCKQI